MNSPMKAEQLYVRPGSMFQSIFEKKNRDNRVRLLAEAEMSHTIPLEEVEDIETVKPKHAIE